MIFDLRAPRFDTRDESSIDTSHGTVDERKHD